MQYYCKNNRRRLMVSEPRDAAGNPVSPQINGIDYLEVLSEDQRSLDIHFLHNLPGQLNPVPNAGPLLSTDNIIIEGGSRIKDIQVIQLNASDNVLRIQVDRAGDFSTYTLRLLASPLASDPPAGFDPPLSFISFSFKVNCPDEFDCKTETLCPPASVQDPRIDYLAKDFSSFRRLMLDRMSLLRPQKPTPHAADLQSVLVEMLAHAGDQLSYYQDAVATEAYLFTARKRTSLRRHARLLDYHAHNGCNARAWVHIGVEVGGPADGLSLPAQTQFLTKGPLNQLTVSLADLQNELRLEGTEVFESMHETLLQSVHNEFQFYTWGDAECCLSEHSTQAMVYREDGLALNLEVGQVLIFEEVKSPATGRYFDADPNKRHVVRLTRINQIIDELTNTTIYEIFWDEADALPFSLCVSARIGNVQIENISVARGNIVLVDHGLSVYDEALIPEQKPQQGIYRPRLDQTNITVVSPLNTSVSDFPASQIQQQDPRLSIPVIKLVEDGELWSAQRDLLASDRTAREFVAEIGDDGKTFLRFGDDILGQEPGPGFSPRANYRVGNGISGNVGAEAIGRIVATTAGISAIRNPLPAQGGIDPESPEEIRQFAPEAFRTQARAVTEADYAAKAELHPEVQRALAQFRWTGSWHTVFLIVDRLNALPIDRDFENELILHLDSFRMAGYDLEIQEPVFVPLEIELNVCVKQGYFRSNIKEKLLTQFSSVNLPDGTQGFFHPDNFTFGQPLYLSRIYQHAMRIDGVSSVEARTFKRWGERSRGEKGTGSIEPVFAEILQLDNDPNFPENGRINFFMYGGL